MTLTDQAFFEEFYDTHKNFLYYLARMYTSSSGDCEDLIQDTIIRLINNIFTLRKIDSSVLAKYVALTVRSAFIDSERAKTKEKLLFFEEGDLEQILETQFPAVDLENKLNDQMKIALLREEIPQRDWVILEGKYILGLSDDEISKMIGVAPDSVRMAIHRARKRAQTILNHSGAEVGD